MAAQRRLRDTTVLVTRPRRQAATFCAMVERAGGRALRFPVIEIRPVEPAATAKAAIHAADTVIFASANAARLGATLVNDAARPQTPAATQVNAQIIAQVIAMGPATAAQLKAQGMGPALVPPSPFNSEALLAMPETRQINGRRYAIIKGAGGRKHLADTLRRRGARVSEASVYIRAKPNTPNTPLAELPHARRAIVAITSAKGLRHLFEMASAEQAQWLKQHAEFLVPGGRVAATAQAAGIRHPPLVAENATDLKMFARLTAG